MTETETNGTTTTAVSIIAPELQIVDWHVTTSSFQVADHFGKRHDNVLKAIRNLIAELPSDYLLHFAEVIAEYKNGKGGTQQGPAYRMTRDGFTLLAMGFTGKEALQWKLAYIDTFNKMEAALTTSPPSRISHAQAQHLRELVQIIAESGKQGHGETWNRLHRKMKVNSYLNLTPAQFDEAVAYLQGKMDGQSMAALVQKHFPDAVKALPAPAQAELDLTSFSLIGVRLLITHDHTGREVIQRVPHDAMLATWDDIANIMRDHFLMPSMKQLASIVSAGVEAMARRSGYGKPDPMPA